MKLYRLLLVLYLSLPLIAYASSTTFNATTSKLEIGTTPAAMRFGSSGAFTASCWLNMHTLGEGSTGKYMNYHAGSGGQWILNVFSSGGNTLIFSPTCNTSGGNYRATTKLTADVWYHVTMAYNGTTGVAWYLNGVVDTTVTGTACVGGTKEANGAFVIGNVTGQTATWDGQIAECALWNRQITANEARAVWACGPKSVPNGLVAYWPLGEYVGATAQNLTTTIAPLATTAPALNHTGPPIRYRQGDKCD